MLKINPIITQHMRDNPEKYVPSGIYCYTYENQEFKLCPFWDVDMDRREQEDGYCHLLKEGDWEGNIGLLWDQCKECDVNDDWELDD